VRHGRWFGLRVWSAQTLGGFYTRTLRVAEDQQVVREARTAGSATLATPPIS
jgi:hypothetical protein